MASYYVNTVAQSNGDHEVHTASCTYVPSESNRIYLGEFMSCQPAVIAAKRYYSQSNGCYWCCRACHTQ
jgi:hypothetical protein